MFYNARWYDPYLGRMAQADTIVPAGVQGLDRYAYSNNNPLNYTDPSGHCALRIGHSYKCPTNPKVTLSSVKVGKVPVTRTPTPFFRTPTDTSKPSQTPTITNTPTSSPTLTLTITLTPSITVTPSATHTPTNTPTPSLTSTPQGSQTPSYSYLVPNAPTPTTISTGLNIYDGSIVSVPTSTIVPTATLELISDPMNQFLGPVGCALTGACEPDFGHEAPELSSPNSNIWGHGGGGGGRLDPELTPNDLILD